MKPLDKVIQIIGSQAALAKRMRVTNQVVYSWKTRGVPPERWFPLSDVVDGRVAAREFFEDWRDQKVRAVTA